MLQYGVPSAPPPLTRRSGSYWREPGKNLLQQIPPMLEHFLEVVRIRAVHFNIHLQDLMLEHLS